MEADPLSPEDRQLFKSVAEVVSEELFARIAVRDRLETVEDADRVADVIVDALWDRFEIRERR